MNRVHQAAVQPDLFARLCHPFQQVWDYREFTLNLIKRDLKARYKNSFFGYLWSLFNPLLMMIVLSVFFGVLSPVKDVRLFPFGFPPFILTGLIAWNLVATSVGGSTSSIISNSNLIKKVYFPREVLPISVVLSNTVNYLLALPILVLVLIFFKVPFLTPNLIFLPLILLSQIIFLCGIAFLFSTLNVFMRDTEVILDVLILAWFFLTPVFYNMRSLPQFVHIHGIAIEVQRLMYILNPPASFIASYRDILYYGSTPGLDFVARTLATSLVIFLLGYLVFRHFSNRFAEEI